jgi:hypothetical protein
MSSFTSRTVIAAFANIEDIIVGVENTKLMLTERQRRMTRDAMKAAEQRTNELCHYTGYNPDDVYLQENLDRVDLELTRRQKPRRITVARRDGRVAKGHSRFVEG